jgi:hypothetical protein
MDYKTLTLIEDASPRYLPRIYLEGPLCFHPLRLVERIGDVILAALICRLVSVREHEMSPRTPLQPL